MDAKTITVNNKILFYDNQNYYLPTEAGFLKDYFIDAAGLKESEITSFIIDKREQEFEFLYTERTTFRSYLNVLYHSLGIMSKGKQRLGGVEFARLCVYLDDKMIRIDNKALRFGTFLDRFDINNKIHTLLLYNVEAGDVWEREEGLRYYMNSNEGNHNEPHVHVDHKHTQSGTISIKTGEMIAGDLSKRIQAKVKRRVLENQRYLVEFWNMHTNGLTVDLNHFFGIKMIDIGR